MFELLETHGQTAVIKVIGVGGAGGNAIAQMVEEQIEGVEFIVANTDAQALGRASAQTVVQIGNDITRGLGAGANPEIGRSAAEEDRERLAAAIEGSDMVFITAGMGGGTGTGAAPVVAEIAKELGILTVAVVTKPFKFERERRMAVAESGIEVLRKHVDSLIIIPNERLLSELDPNVSLLDGFKLANEVLQGAVQGIAELITRPGLINVDFADVRTVMSEMGMAVMGSATAAGEGRAKKAAESAITSPFLEKVDLAGARGVLVNITAGLDLSLGEFQEVGDVVKGFASDNATVVVGTVIDPDAGGEMRVTVVATGLGEGESVERGDAALELVNTISTATGEIDYTKLDKPTALRQGRRDERGKPLSEVDMEYLEIPAFLRRQAD